MLRSGRRPNVKREKIGESSEVAAARGAFSRAQLILATP